MRLDYELSPDLERLTLKLPEGETLDPDTTEDEVFADRASNTSFWMIPEGTVAGDLTAAPCIGFVGEEEIGRGGTGTNAIETGFWDDHPRRQRVIARWGWMRYAVEDLADALREDGYATFEGGLVMPTADDLVLEPLVVTREMREGLFAALTDRKIPCLCDKLSELVEDPDSDPATMRKVAARLLVRLNAADQAKRATLIKLLNLS